jgi:hypothetical protein
MIPGFTAELSISRGPFRYVTDGIIRDAGRPAVVPQARKQGTGSAAGNCKAKCYAVYHAGVLGCGSNEMCRSIALNTYSRCKMGCVIAHPSSSTIE